MKITRIFLTFAAALSLGLAVFGNARIATAATTRTSAQSAFKVADDNTDLLPDLPPDNGGSGGGGDSGH